MFKSERKKYKEDSEEYSKRSVLENKYYLLGSNYFKNIVNNNQLDDQNVKYFYDICKEWDDYGSLDLDIGLELESLIDNKDFILGVHRTFTNATIDSEGMIHSGVVDSIFDQGLKNFGDLNSSGVAINEAPDPAKTLTPITNIMNAVICLKSSYKNSDVSVLVALPEKYVDRDLEFTGNYQKKIYDIKDGIPTIKQKYLVGAVYQEDGNCKYYSKEQIKKTKGKLEII